jgi:hypothetical protein
VSETEVVGAGVGPGGGRSPRDLGPIEGREVPGTGGPVEVPVVRRGLGGELRQAARDIPNSRPLPDWVRRLAWILDDAFSVPGTQGRRVGVDGMLTLVPVVGDLAGLGLSMVVVLAGVGAGVSLPTTLRMLLNVGFESLAGLVPFGGALFDMVYKANNRNVRLIEQDLSDRRRTRRSSAAVLGMTVLVLAVGAVMTVLVMMAGVALLVWFVAWLIG